MTFNDLFKAEDVTPEYDPQDIQDNKTMGILSYISWLVLIPIFKAKDSAYARFNANQGLVLAIAGTALSIISSILGKIPFIGWLFTLICSLGTAGCGVLSVFGIVFAAMGKVKKLPIISKFQILK